MSVACTTQLPSVYFGLLLQVRAKTSLMTDYCTKYSDATHVPDPYYGGPAGFEKVGGLRLQAGVQKTSIYCQEPNKSHIPVCLAGLQ